VNYTIKQRTIKARSWIPNNISIYVNSNFITSNCASVELPTQTKLELKLDWKYHELYQSLNIMLLTSLKNCKEFYCEKCYFKV